MDKRNTIFKDIANHLEAEYEMERQSARTLAKQALVENRVGPGIVSITNDLCTGVEPTCDSSSKFRTITGVCNNLNYRYWGAMSTPFPREMEIGKYNPKMDFNVTDGNIVAGGYGRADKYDRSSMYFLQLCSSF